MMVSAASIGPLCSLLFCQQHAESPQQPSFVPGDAAQIRLSSGSAAFQRDGPAEVSVQKL